MMYNCVPPQAGETIPLLCTKCHHMFLGQNPRGWKGLYLSVPLKKAKCPKCGSKKVIPYPFIYY